MNPAAKYVLVTPARNEAPTLGITIASVLAQTVRPAEWVIVSDGSTDDTDRLVLAAARTHAWIRLVSLPPRPAPCFAAVVRATETGIRELGTPDYDFVGLLDADVRFQPDYFAQVIAAFAADPRLGLAGGLVVDVGEPKDRLPRNRSDVPGAVQFFRRACFEALGGLIAIPEGGWDGLTCAEARRQGYRTQLLTGLVVDHLKPRNVSQGGALRRKWQMGVRDYAVGCDPVFELCKCASRVAEAPPVFGSAAWLVGYLCAAAQRRERHLPAELQAFMRWEQRQRLNPFRSSRIPAGER